MRQLGIIAALIVLVAGTYLWVHHRVHPVALPAQTSVPASGTRAQDVLLTDLNGRQFRTSDYRGKVLMVNFWAAWCAPCAEEIPQFVAMQDKYRSRGLQIVGVSVEDIESELRTFCAKNKVNYPVVPGNQAVADSFGGVLGLPTTILIDKDGVIHKKYSGATDFALLEHDLMPLLAAVKGDKSTLASSL